MKKRKTNKAKQICISCRNNGTCELCRSNRLRQSYREIQKMKSKLEEFLKEKGGDMEGD